MARLQLPLVAILVCIFSIIHNVIGQKDSIPVLIWESSRLTTPDIPIPALKKFDNAEFNDYLSNKLNIDEKPLILVFVEDNLSLEDFSTRDADNQIYFPQLESITSQSGKVSFLPAVQSPLKVLKTFRKSPVKEFHYKDLYKDSLKLKNQDINLVLLDNVADSGDRPDMLKDHDRIIADIYTRSLTKFPQIISIYTGKYPSWLLPDGTTRRKRETSPKEPTEEESGVLWKPNYNDDWVLFYFLSGSVTIGETTTDLTKNFTLKPFPINNKEPRFGVRYNNFTLYFGFVLSLEQYWTMKIEYVSLTNDKMNFSNSQVTAPIGLSYHCSQNIIFLNQNASSSGSLTMESLQVFIYPFWF